MNRNGNLTLLVIFKDLKKSFHPSYPLCPVALGLIFVPFSEKSLTKVNFFSDEMAKRSRRFNYWPISLVSSSFD